LLNSFENKDAGKKQGLEKGKIFFENKKPIKQSSPTGLF